MTQERQFRCSAEILRSVAKELGLAHGAEGTALRCPSCRQTLEVKVAGIPEDARWSCAGGHRGDVVALVAAARQCSREAAYEVLDWRLGRTRNYPARERLEQQPTRAVPPRSPRVRARAARDELTALADSPGRAAFTSRPAPDNAPVLERIADALESIAAQLAGLGSPNISSAAVPEERLWTVDEVAGFLGCSNKAVYQRVAHGQLPVIRLGRRVLFEPTRVRRNLGLGNSARSRR